MPVTGGLLLCENYGVAPVRRPSLSVGRDQGRTEDRGQRTGCKKPVPVSCLPSPVRLSAISYQLPTTYYQLQAGRAHSKSALRATRTSKQIVSRLCEAIAMTTRWELGCALQSNSQVIATGA